MQAIAWDLFTAFTRMGHRVTVLTTGIPNREDDFEEDGVRVIALRDAAPERYSGAWWRESCEYARRFANNVDAVLSISIAAAGLFPLRANLNVPFVGQLHGTSWGEVLSKWQSGRLLEMAKSVRNLYWFARDASIYRGFDHLVLIGDALALDFGRAPTRWIVKGIPSSVIRNGIDTRLFFYDSRARLAIRHSFGWTDQQRVVIFVARLHAQKGAADAIRTFSILRSKDSNYRLLMVGGGPEEASLRSLVKSLGCDQQVVFTGAVSREHIPRFLSAADAFAFPSHRMEGLPMNVLEALAVGLPCVCAESLRPVLGDLNSIAYAPPRNPELFAAALAESVSSRARNISMLPAEFELRHCAEAYIELIDRLRHR